jgi:hypothetical protein
VQGDCDKSEPAPVLWPKIDTPPLEIMDYDIKMCKIGDDSTKQLGWSDNVWKIFGCMKPVFSLIGNRTNIFDVNKNRSDGSWEVPFEMISGMCVIAMWKKCFWLGIPAYHLFLSTSSLFFLHTRLGVDWIWRARRRFQWENQQRNGCNKKSEGAPRDGCQASLKTGTRKHCQIYVRASYPFFFFL